MRKTQTIYGIYKGDNFIDVGTADELAERLTVKKGTIRFYANPANIRRNKSDNRIIAVKFLEKIEVVG